MNDEKKPPEGPPLREISGEDLNKILEAHAKWVESGGKEGERADLSRTNLTAKNLEGNDCSGAIFTGADLRDSVIKKAKFIDADFRGANLSGKKTELDGIDLLRADLREADLQDSDLSTVTGLLLSKLAGANVSNSKLPEAIEKFSTLETITETSKNARKIFLALLLGCVYSLLTIATTTDVKLLTNSTSSPLPIIQTALPIVWLYWAAPLALFGFFIYLHFYLGMLWEGLAGLPAIFPDGKRLDERAYPWLLNGLVRRHFPRLMEGRSRLVKFKELTTIFLAWWTIPLTLCALWLRYLPRHDWPGTLLHIIVLGASVALGIIFYPANTLRGNTPPPFPWKKFWSDRRTYKVAGLPLVSLVLLGMLSFVAIVGVDEYGPVSADLVEVDVSIKPPNWTDMPSQNNIVKGARLKETDLRKANAQRAFLVNADLQDADLREANLKSADLRGAYINQTNLREADLSGANLHGVHLQNVNLEKAVLIGTMLHEVVFTSGVNLQQALLMQADLREATLELAMMQGAQLHFANLTDANLRGAWLDNAILENAKLINTNLEGASLFGANLQGAQLDGANLQGADLREAKMTLEAGREFIELRGAKNNEKAFYSDDVLRKLDLPPDHSKRLCKALMNTKLRGRLFSLCEEFLPKQAPDSE